MIMAGGSGERFWPFSRRKKPKQLLKLTSPDKTMIEEAIERIAPLIPLKDIFIITSELLQPIIREALPEIPPENIIAEPAKRNTAPCIALAAAVIVEKYAAEGIAPNAISMSVLTADHLILDAIKFHQTVAIALNHAEQTGDLVTIGIKPTRAETGYGYIEVGSQFLDAILPVKSFREKPDAKSAEEFVLSQKFLWNSGMFFWRLDALIDNLCEFLPEVGGKIADLRSVLNSPSEFLEIFAAMPDISIDYGLMERARKVSVVPAAFEWDDVGSWDGLERSFLADSLGNITFGSTASVDSTNCILVGDDSIAVTAIGVENLVIVATPDGVLVCQKDKAQDVKKIVQILREKYGEKFL